MARGRNNTSWCAGASVPATFTLHRVKGQQGRPVQCDGEIHQEEEVMAKIVITVSVAVEIDVDAYAMEYGEPLDTAAADATAYAADLLATTSFPGGWARCVRDSVTVTS